MQHLCRSLSGVSRRRRHSVFRRRTRRRRQLRLIFQHSRFLLTCCAVGAMAGTPRDTPVSLLFASPSPTRGGSVEPFTQRQPSWGPPVATPVTPGSRYLQPLQAPRSDGPAARWKNIATPTECPPLPVASSLFSVRADAAAALCGSRCCARVAAERAQRRTWARRRLDRRTLVRGCLLAAPRDALTACPQRQPLRRSQRRCRLAAVCIGCVLDCTRKRFAWRDSALRRTARSGLRNRTPPKLGSPCSAFRRRSARRCCASSRSVCCAPPRFKRALSCDGAEMRRGCCIWRVFVGARKLGAYLLQPRRRSAARALARRLSGACTAPLPREARAEVARHATADKPAHYRRQVDGPAPARGYAGCVDRQVFASASAVDAFRTYRARKPRFAGAAGIASRAVARGGETVPARAAAGRLCCDQRRRTTELLGGQVWPLCLGPLVGHASAMKRVLLHRAITASSLSASRPRHHRCRTAAVMA